MTVHPLTLSPGGSRYDYRLGDARLQCRVLWAMARAEAPVLAMPIIGAADMVGACSRRRIGIYEGLPRPIRTATVAEGARTGAVEVTPSRRSYRLPLADGRFGDEARVRIAVD